MKLRLKARCVRVQLCEGESFTKSIIQTSLRSFESQGFGLWAVSSSMDETLIGFCGFWLFHEPPKLELLYGVARDYWKRDIATEAAKAMIKYGFDELSFERIEAHNLVVTNWEHEVFTFWMSI